MYPTIVVTDLPDHRDLFRSSVAALAPGPLRDVLDRRGLRPRRGRPHRRHDTVGRPVAGGGRGGGAGGPRETAAGSLLTASRRP